MISTLFMIKYSKALWIMHSNYTTFYNSSFLIVLVTFLVIVLFTLAFLLLADVIDEGAVSDSAVELWTDKDSVTLGSTEWDSADDTSIDGVSTDKDSKLIDSTAGI